MKAYLRGVLNQQVAKFNKEARVGEENIQREVIEAENNYVINPTPRREKIWLDKQDYKIAVMRKAETRQLLTAVLFCRGRKRRKDVGAGSEVQLPTFYYPYY